MLKFRALPETNSSSSHALVITDALPGRCDVVPPDCLPQYTYEYISFAFPDETRSFFLEYAKKEGWKINTDEIDFDYPIDNDTEVDIKTHGINRSEAAKAIARMYHLIVKKAIERGYVVEMEFDATIKNPIVPVLGAAFYSSEFHIYKPGNYYVAILTDTTENNTVFGRIKFAPDDKTVEFIPEVPESIDLKITNKCYAMCPFCHENSTPDGEHADSTIIDEFLKTVEKTPIPEVAIGGGNPLLHPEINSFIRRLSRHSIVAITARDVDYIEYGIPRHVKGYGISLTSPKRLAFLLSDSTFYEGYPVIHVINGVHKTEEVSKALSIYELLYDGHYLPAVLILGFKNFGRGANWKIKNTIDVEALRKKHPNAIIALDDLAIKQLSIREKMPSKDWDLLYNGEDGKFTMYIDLVKEQYARNSYSAERHRIEEWDIRKMFDKVHVK